MEIVDEPMRGAGYGTVSVATATATLIPPAASLDANQRVLTVANHDATNTLYYGWDNLVTGANGSPIAPGASISLSLDASQTLYVYQGSGGATDCRWNALKLA